MAFLVAPSNELQLYDSMLLERSANCSVSRLGRIYRAAKYQPLQRDGLAGLRDAPRLGRHRRWNDADWQAIEQWLSQPRRYSAAQLSQKLASERQVQLGAEPVRRTLKKNLSLEAHSYNPGVGLRQESCASKTTGLGTAETVGTNG